MPERTKKIKIIINGKEYAAKKGKLILDVCRKNDISVAALCHHSDFERNEISRRAAQSDSLNQRMWGEPCTGTVQGEAVCRLCLVKVKLPKEKIYRFAPSCVLKAVPGMKIITSDAEIDRIRKTILELLFLEHAGLCASCYRNMNCELQALAIKYSIDEFRFVPRVAEMESEEALERLRDNLSRKVIDVKNPSIARDSSKCVECRRCIRACSEIQSVKAIGIRERGIRMGTGTEYNTPLECTYCGQCALHCPTAAIIEKSEAAAVIKALKDPDKIVIAQIAPSVRVTLGEEFGMLTGSVVTGKTVAALRKCGFDLVFDVDVGADLTVLEEATELIERIRQDNRENPLPMFTSCCPAWVLFCEQFYPEILPHLSSTRSPQMMMGSLIKTYYARNSKLNPENIVVVSVMPCTAKKYEITRPEFSRDGIRDVDHVLTVRELAHMIKNLNIPFAGLPDEDFDPPLGISTGAGVIFGATGGVAEAAVRTAYHYVTGKSLPQLEVREARGLKGIRETNFKLGDGKLAMALVNGLGNARKIAEMTLRGKSPYTFIEVMGCPGGCVGGGGQPYPVNDEVRSARTKSIYATDRHLPIRESHKNPVVQKIYRDFLYKPGSRKAEKLLHTKHYPFEYKLRKEHGMN